MAVIGLSDDRKLDAAIRDLTKGTQRCAWHSVRCSGTHAAVNCSSSEWQEQRVVAAEDGGSRGWWQQRVVAAASGGSSRVLPLSTNESHPQSDR